MPIGFLILGIGIVSGGIRMWIIDPKLKRISHEYEKKQKDYLRQLEEIQKGGTGNWVQGLLSYLGGPVLMWPHSWG